MSSGEADHPAGARHSRGAHSRKGPTPGFPRGELLTVDVLDEAGGPGHIVHFELRQSCSAGRGRPVARRRDEDWNPPLTYNSIAASRRKRLQVTPPTSGIACPSTERGVPGVRLRAPFLPP